MSSLWKRTPLATAILLLAAALFLSLLLAVVLKPRPSHRLACLGRAVQDAVGGDYHSLCVLEGGWRVLQAPHNLDVIARANHYMASLGSQTLVYRDIARVAASLDHECALLDSVLSLAVRRRSDSAAVVELARRAGDLVSPADSQAWWREYRRLSATAEYPTVAAALAAERAAEGR